MIKYLEPLQPTITTTIHDTEQQQQSHPSTPPPAAGAQQQQQQQQLLLREVNLMAAASPGPVVPVGKAARTLAVHCLLGLGAAYFNLGDAPVRGFELIGDAVCCGSEYI